MIDQVNDSLLLKYGAQTLKPPPQTAETPNGYDQCFKNRNRYRNRSKVQPEPEPEPVEGPTGTGTGRTGFNEPFF